jgi:hypothetical protein
MFSFRRPTAAGDGVLDLLSNGLPDGFNTIDAGDAVVVVGPPGAFVVACAAGEDPGPLADGLHQLALVLRTVLAQDIGLVPFIDPLVVVPDGAPAGMIAATRVPADLLLPTITEGPGLLASTVVSRMADALRALLQRNPDGLAALAGADDGSR